MVSVLIVSVAAWIRTAGFSGEKAAIVPAEIAFVFPVKKVLDFPL